MATTTSIVFDRGFVNSAVYNGFGVAVGTGLLRGLDQEQFVNALGITGAHASGIGGNGPTPTGRYHAGMPAANGIRAARLAKLGLRATPAIFEEGYLRAFTAHAKPELLTENLGEEWPGVMGLRLKKTYCSTGNIAPQIEALQSILSENAIHHSDIKEIRLGLDPLMFVTAGIQPDIEKIKDTIAAHFSTHLQLAITAVKGRNDFMTLSELARDGFHDPDIVRVAGLINVALDPECEALYPDEWMAKVTVVTNDGRTFEARAYAMTEPDAEEKFRTLLEPIIPSARIDAIVDRVKSLEELKSVEEIAELLEIPAT